LENPVFLQELDLVSGVAWQDKKLFENPAFLQELVPGSGEYWKDYDGQMGR
jgi:hypothetical protein